MSWREDEADYLAGAERELRAAAMEAMGEWLEKLRAWSAFGSLTVDPRRRKLQRVETRSPAIAEWRGELGRGFLPVVSGGGRVLYSHRLDVPRALSRDMAVWMVEQAMREAGRLLRRRLDWVAAIEPHKSGDLHAHLLVYTGQVGEGRDDFRALWAGWYSLAGYCKFSAPRDNMAVSEYASKYVCKPEGELIFSSKLHLPAGPELRRLPFGG